MTEAEIREMPAGPEMDALVAELVMGWRPYENGRQYCDLSCGLPADRDVDDFIHYSCSYEIPDDWSPSTDIAAAWLVVEKITARNPPFHESPEWGLELRQIGDGWGVRLYGSHVPMLEAEADTAPLAICRAALLTTVEE
jgi:hypothetical protein